MIFNRKLRGALVEIEMLKIEIDELNSKNEELELNYKLQLQRIEEVKKQKDTKTEKLKEDYKNNKKVLKETLLELNETKLQLDNITKEYEEFKKNKFIVKEVTSGRKPRTQTMKVKSSNVTSKIIKKIKED